MARRRLFLKGKWSFGPLLMGFFVNFARAPQIRFGRVDVAAHPRRRLSMAPSGESVLCGGMNVVTLVRPSTLPMRMPRCTGCTRAVDSESVTRMCHSCRWRVRWPGRTRDIRRTNLPVLLRTWTDDCAGPRRQGAVSRRRARAVGIRRRASVCRMTRRNLPVLVEHRCADRLGFRHPYGSPRLEIAIGRMGDHGRSVRSGLRAIAFTRACPASAAAFRRG